MPPSEPGLAESDRNDRVPSRTRRTSRRAFPSVSQRCTLTKSTQTRGTPFAVAVAGFVRQNSCTGVSFPFFMAVNTAQDVRVNASAGHLSVHFEEDHPPEVPFLFDVQPKRLSLSFAAAVALDVLGVVFTILLMQFQPRTFSAEALLPDKPNDKIIWLAEPGPGGGGGGGGNQMKEPPRQAELPGKDKITVPVEKPPKLEPPKQAKNEPNPIEQLNIPAKDLAAAQDSLPGAIEAPPGAPTISQGSGSGGGAGTGTGTGIGPGSGSGLGPG